MYTGTLLWNIISVDLIIFDFLRDRSKGNMFGNRNNAIMDLNQGFSNCGTRTTGSTQSFPRHKQMRIPYWTHNKRKLHI